jgi:hypothetical protein
MKRERYILFPSSPLAFMMMGSGSLVVNAISTRRFALEKLADRQCRD